MTIRTFYDDLSPRYHLIYDDWDASIARQGRALASLVAEHFPAARELFDVAVGVGTQALGLAAHGYEVVGSDLSSGSVRRAEREATRRALAIPVYVADFQRLPIRPGSADLIVCCDNSLPHLESPAAVGATLREWHRCIRPGGGCLLSMRDYGTPPAPGTVDERPYGQRVWNGHRYLLRQVWRWDGPRYEVALEMTPLDDGTPAVPTLTASYLAISPADVQGLMRDAGFVEVRRIDGRFFQPVLLGHTRAAR